MKKYISVKLLRFNWLIRWNDNGTLKRFTCFTESMNDNIFLFLSPSCNLLHLKCQAGTDYGLSRNDAKITTFIWLTATQLETPWRCRFVRDNKVIYSYVIPSSQSSCYITNTELFFYHLRDRPACCLWMFPQPHSEFGPSFTDLNSRYKLSRGKKLKINFTRSPK